MICGAALQPWEAPSAEWIIADEGQQKIAQFEAGARPLFFRRATVP
jgi:ABC-type tungstate transport system permease subunit